MNRFRTVTKKISRISAMFLVALLLLSSVDYGVLKASAAEETEIACQNHTAHTADCGYAEAVEGADCTHEHGEECYAAVTECVHVHGEECYRGELTCESAEEHEHSDECYTKNLICSHECSQESGCIRQELDCRHVHDEGCGYRQAAEGQPCTHSCELCSKAAEEDPEEGAAAEEEACICEEACTEDTINKDCPVCSLEAAELEKDCKGKKAQAEPSPKEKAKQKNSAANDKVAATAEAGSSGETHSHGDKPFSPWTVKDMGNGNCTLDEGSYYLTGDVTLPSQLYISSTVDICLNGHTLNLSGKTIYLNGATLTIYDCAAGGGTGKITGGKGYYDGQNRNYKGGAVYVKGSTLNIYGGSIEGNGADWGGAIFIDGTAGAGTVNMHGGTIQGNTATRGGGGIEIENPASAFNMDGGSIVGNSVTAIDGGLHKGGGVHFANGSMTVGGTVQITGNTVGGTENNVYLRNVTGIVVNSLSEGSRIGVSASGAEGNSAAVTITSGYSAVSSAEVKYFFMDGTHNRAGYVLIHNGTELQIKAHSHAWSYRAAADGNKLYAYCTTGEPRCGYYGDSCTALPLTITAESPFPYGQGSYDGAKLDADELSAFNAATGNSLTNDAIVYYTDAALTKRTTAENGAAAEGKAPSYGGTYYAAVEVGGAKAKAEFIIEKDKVAPEISGIKDGGKYCEAVSFTVTDNGGSATVTLDGTTITPDGSGRYTITGDNKSHIIVAKDMAGNETKCTAVIYAGHDFDKPVYTEKSRNGNVITEEASCGHGCGRKLVRKRTTEGDVISQEYPGSSGSDGSLETKIEVEPGTPATSVKGLNVDVADKLLSDVEREQVKNGENLLVYLKVNMLTEAAVPADDKASSEGKAAAISGLQQGVYLDLSIWKKIGTASEVQVNNAQTAKKLKITITLPEELKASSGKVRTYYVIRVHNGAAEVLPTELNGNKISFMTDMFSTYSIWYKESAASAPSGGGGNTPGQSGGQGDQGDSGQSGGQGDQGSSGSQGSSGAQGDSGQSGSQGAQGSSGQSGSQGAQGSSGSQGSQGAQGSSGSQNQPDDHNSGSNGNSGNTNAPKTGDESNMALWVMLLLLSAVALSGITAKRKKDSGFSL